MTTDTLKKEVDPIEISKCCKAGIGERGHSIYDLYCLSCNKSLGWEDIIELK